MEQGLKKGEGLGKHDFHETPFREASSPHFIGRKAESPQRAVWGEAAELGSGQSQNVDADLSNWSCWTVSFLIVISP